jgi:hypothetical protein
LRFGGAPLTVAAGGGRGAGFFDHADLALGAAGDVEDGVCDLTQRGASSAVTAISCEHAFTARAVSPTYPIVSLRGSADSL